MEEKVFKDIPTFKLIGELWERGYCISKKDYFNQNDIVANYSVKPVRANKLVKEFEIEVKKNDFYKPMAFIKYNQQVWEVHKNQFRHFLKYSKCLKDKNLRKLVPKYNPADFEDGEIL